MKCSRAISWFAKFFSNLWNNRNEGLHSFLKSPMCCEAGSSVRNIAAFQVLHNVFMKSSTTSLCSVILDAISTIFHSDPINYFILEPQNTLNQFSERIHLKSTEVQVQLVCMHIFFIVFSLGQLFQEKFFRLLEFVVFQLNYVPCKELISLSLLLKNHASSHTSCCQLCLVLLLSILRLTVCCSIIFSLCIHFFLFFIVVPGIIRFSRMSIVKWVFWKCSSLVCTVLPASWNWRSSSIHQLTLVIVPALLLWNCCRNARQILNHVLFFVALVFKRLFFCALPDVKDPELEMGYLVMESLSVLLVGNANNAAIFRESGGARCAHNLIPYPQCRREALGTRI